MVELRSNAEKLADQARELPNFKDFPLPGVKEHVAQILDMIGRVEGIFSTYTKHDISHIDTMLDMLDWLIPPSTKEIMSPVEWLLITLSVYLHDLGMVVTADEYFKREENSLYNEFREGIEKDPNGKDYLARVNKSMATEEKERFFYQEFIRSEHAKRIREWISGRHSTYWGENVKPVSDKIADILRYWVILPACHVVYVERGSEPQRIGFDTCIEALRYFHSDDYEGDRMGSISYEMLEAPPRHEEEQSYELAFMVRSTWTPEQNFVLNRNENAPAVCLEGIRVDNHLPGYDVRDRSDYRMSRRGSSSVCALLSVRGNKNFRTTVSRSDLERDGEYFRVAEICTELLFKHIKREVRRISKKRGKSLSQASTAGRWIYRILSESIYSSRVSNFIHGLYVNIPSIVVEEIDIDVDKNSIKTNRNLVSQNELGKMKIFWTIESRLSDYLGYISRDLGRELSLNNFLGALAPEL